MSVLANAWVARGTSVTLITLSDSASDFYRIDPRIHRIALCVSASSHNALTGAARNVRRIRTLRAAIRAETPDAVLSFMTATNVLSILACRSLRIPCIVSERVSPPNPAIRGPWALGFRYAYPRAHAIVAQTDRAATWLRSRFPAVPIHVIANPVVLEHSSNGEGNFTHIVKSAAEGQFIAAMGRLTSQKGFDLLLRAFASLAVARSGWSLTIIGDGPERANLERQIEALGLARRVRLVGLLRNPHQVLRRAAAFVLPSRYEGMPTALLEAMACGLPCVSYDCPTGPREIIQDGINGLLVPPGDVVELAQALGRVMDNDDLRRRLGGQAANVVRDFAVDRIIAQWDKLVRNLASPNRGAVSELRNPASGV